MYKNKIIFSPAHYTFDEYSRGSELSWAYNIVNYLASLYKNSLVITGFKNLKTKKKYSIIELTPQKKEIDLGLLNSLIFNAKYSFTSFKLLLESRFDLHHHVLPFSIGRTYDLFKVLGFKGSKKYIIGPIQSPIPDYDDNISDYSGESQSLIFIKVKTLLLSIFEKILMFLSKNTLNKADKIIVIDQKTKKHLLNLGLDKKKIEIITPGIKSTDFLPKKKKNKVEKLRLITVSYLISRKKIDKILKALSILKNQNQDFSLDIVGDGPQKELLQKLTKEYDLVNFVNFKGHIPHHKIQKYYSQADLFVTMSENESWGQMYLEAMACGLPILSSSNNGSNNIIKDYFGTIVDTDQELAKEILKLIKDRNKLFLMSKAARQEVLSKYDWQKVIIPQFVRVYKDLLK